MNALLTIVLAVQMLTALPYDLQTRPVVATLGALGANREMMQAVARKVEGHWLWPASWMFMPTTRGVLDDPAFPGFAQKLGLMHYWKATHTRPDVCSGKDAPLFCRMI